MPDVFVSYASQDRDRIRPYVEALEADGMSVWWDQRIDLGTSYDREIERYLEEAKCVLVFWSKHSVVSDWVRIEAQEGLDRNILVPALLDDVKPPLAFRLTQAADLDSAGGAERLVASVARCIGQEPDTSEVPASVKSGPRSRWRAVLAGTVLILVGAVALFVLREGADRSGHATPTIAVLPFADRSPEGNRQYFSDGVAEEIIARLATVQGMRVVGSGSSFRFRGAEVDYADIAEQLSATHVLEGSVRTAGERVRITAQLTRLPGNTAVWTKTFDNDFADILAVQDEVAVQVVSVVGETLNLAPAARRPVEQAAYEAYLRGAAEFRATQYPAAIEHFERAIEIDPTFPAPHAALAQLYINWPGFGVHSLKGLLPELQLNLARLKSLDPRHPVGARVQARIDATFSANWEPLVTLMTEQARQHPNERSAFFELQRLYGALGMIDDYERSARYLLTLDPLSPWDNMALARALYFFREDTAPAKAIWQAGVQRADMFVPASYDLCVVGIIEGNPEADRHCVDYLDNVAFGVEAARIAFDVWRAFYARDQRALADSLNALDRSEAQPPFKGFIAAMAGELDQAFAYLNEAADDHNPGVLVVVSGMPYMSNSRGQRDRFVKDPRHDALLAKLGLKGLKLPPASAVLP